MSARKKSVFGTICIILIFVLLTSTLGWITKGFRDWNPKSWFDKTCKHEYVNGVCTKCGDEQLVNDFTSEIQDTQHVKLAMGSVVTSSENYSVSKPITAIILPETAINKLVDWSVAWGAENTAVVTDYITVTLEFDGSTNAKITCWQGFTGTIIITVTTRENGYTATCVVSFSGLPTGIALGGADSGLINTTINTISLGIGETYEFDVVLSNPFNFVGSQFNDVTCTLSGVGKFVLADMEHYRDSGEDAWDDSSEKFVELDSLKDNFISMSCSSGKITITTIKSFESYYESVKHLDGGRQTSYKGKFRELLDDCIFRLMIRENISGLEEGYTIRFDETIVSGIQLSPDEIEF